MFACLLVVSVSKTHRDKGTRQKDEGTWTCTETDIEAETHRSVGSIKKRTNNFNLWIKVCFMLQSVKLCLMQHSQNCVQPLLFHTTQTHIQHDGDYDEGRWFGRPTVRSRRRM